jgi:CRISPR-associated protein Cas5h
MPSGKVVVFDIWSSYGYFRRPYTTTTSLTFNFVPRSAIEGIIGAILGISNKDLASKLAESKISVGILNAVRKMPFSTMHTHSDFWRQMRTYLEERPVSKKDDPYHTRVNMELLVDPKYMIYFDDSKLSDELTNMLAKHQTIFTPYLGTSSMIANFAYVNVFDYTIIRKEIAEISSVVPYSDRMPSIVIEKDKVYAVEQNMPARLNEKRELLSSYSAVFSPNGQATIKIKDIEVNTFHHDGVEHSFVFLPA